MRMAAQLGLPKPAPDSMCSEGVQTSCRVHIVVWVSGLMLHLARAGHRLAGMQVHQAQPEESGYRGPCNPRHRWHSQKTADCVSHLCQQSCLLCSRHSCTWAHTLFSMRGCLAV